MENRLKTYISSINNFPLLCSKVPSISSFHSIYSFCGTSKVKSTTQSEVKSKRSSIFNKKSKDAETTSTKSATVTYGGETPNPALTGTTIDSLLEGTVNNDVQSMGSTLSKKGITKARKKTNNGDLNINCK